MANVKTVYSDEEKELNVFTNLILSSLLCRRQPQLITAVNNNPKVWIFTNGCLEAPGHGDPKIRLDETYHRVTFKSDKVEELLNQIPQFKDSWVIDLRGFNAIRNKHKNIIDLKVIQTIDELNVLFDNQNVLIGKTTAPTYHPMLVDFFDNIDHIDKFKHTIIELSKDDFELGKIFYKKIVLKEVFKQYDLNFAMNWLKLPFIQGYNTISYNEYIKKSKQKTFTLFIYVWLEKGFLKYGTIYEDDDIKVVSIRPLMYNVPKLLSY